jgi:hypothetical protein
MRSALAAPVAALALGTAAPVLAQDSRTAQTEQGTAAPQPPRESLEDRLKRRAREALLKEIEKRREAATRPAPTEPEPPAEPREPSPPADTGEKPPEPPVVGTSPAQPSPAAAAGTPPAPAPGAALAPPPAPLPPAATEPRPPAPKDVEVLPPPAPENAFGVEVLPEPEGKSRFPWLILLLAAVAAATAAVAARTLHRRRLVRRTRQAVGLVTRLDTERGGGSAPGMKLAAPPRMLQSWPDDPEERNG